MIMNSTVKKLALAFGMALSGISLTASAQQFIEPIRYMQVAQDNLGQALIFPYYTVRGGWMTLFGVTNTSDQIVAVKVRFRESYNSRDVLDFNVILSPHDVWTGWVADSVSGPTIFSQDNSCTVGAISASGVPFPSPISYVGAAADGGPTTTDRMREGYVEMIMMGSADPADTTALPTTALARGAIHSATTGAPADCAALVSAFQTPATLPQLRGEFRNYGGSAAQESVGNPLMGTFSLVNGVEGYSAAGKPVTLANFFVPFEFVEGEPISTCTVPPEQSAFGQCALITLQLSQVAANNNFYDSWNEPSLNAARGMLARLTPDYVVWGFGIITEGADLVSIALLQTSVINEWTRRTNPAAGWTTGTDWVITFPTKNFYVDNQPNNEFAGRNTGRGNTGTTPEPFTQMFTDAEASPVVARGSSCDGISYQLYNREEVRAAEGGFSPGATPQLCYEANVLTFGGSNILNSGTPASINSLVGTFGWANVRFANSFFTVARIQGSASIAARSGGSGGLPVVGFALTNRNDSASALLSEASLVEHSYSLDLGFIPDPD